jgi:hypothetical protein
MTLSLGESLGEIEAMAKKAARGAGYSWGLADEAGAATRFLCAQGLPGCETLARLLDAGFAHPLPAHRPRSLAGPWRGDGPLCPLITGAALADDADRLLSDPLRIENIALPLFLLPFAAMASRQIALPVVIEADTASATAAGFTLALTGTFPASANLTLHIGEGPEHLPPLRTRATPTPQAWASLSAHAHRTYAPATDASRLKGAGAGLSDND